METISIAGRRDAATNVTMGSAGPGIALRKENQ
jgi:hypothetical protein